MTATDTCQSITGPTLLVAAAHAANIIGAQCIDDLLHVAGWVPDEHQPKSLIVHDQDILTRHSNRQKICDMSHMSISFDQAARFRRS